MMIIDRFQEFQAEEVAELIKRNLLEIASKYYPPEYVASLVEGFSPGYGYLAENENDQIEE